MKNILKITSSPIAVLSGAALVASVAFTQVAYSQSTDGATQEQIEEQAPELTKEQKKAAKKEARKAEKQAAKEAEKEQSQQEAQPVAEEKPAPTPEPATQEQKVEKTEPAPEKQEAATSEPAPEEQPVESVESEAKAEEQPAQEPASEDTKKAAKQEARKERKAERKAQRKAERKAERSKAEQAEEEAAAKQAEAEAKEPVTVSEDAVIPKEVEPASAEKLVEEAAKEQVVVVPDEITAKQKAALQSAEKKRRKEAKQRRREILGAAAVGAVIGAVIPQLGGRVAADEGDVLVIERDDGYVIQRDDSSLLRGKRSRTTYENLNNGRTREVIRRPNGVTVITVRDASGAVLRRVKEFPNGERVVLYDFREDNRRARVDYDRRLAPIQLEIPRDRYVVSARRADRRLFYDTLVAEPVEQVEEQYTLRDIRENERLRAKVRRVDLDTIQFATGSAYVTQSQVRLLGDVAGAMLDVVDRDPSAVFFIEGHTDAVGSEISNLTLSDRRAEAVGRILSEAYDVPPENLVIQGYGEEYLKVDTDGPSAANRRATIRNISPLLAASR